MLKVRKINNIAKKQRIVIGVLLTTLCAFFMAHYYVQQAFAAHNYGQTFDSVDTCRDTAPATEASAINDACSKCFNSGSSSRWGVFWINNMPTNAATQTAEVNFETTNNDEDDADDSKFMAYLHGSYINCSGSARNNEGMNARNIHFVKVKDGIRNYSDSSYYEGDSNISNKELPFIEAQFSNTDRLWRFKRGDGDVPLANKTWASQPTDAPLAFKIDLGKFGEYVESAEGQERCDKSENSVQCTIGLFRCPTSVAEGSITSQCWANNAILQIDNIEVNTFSGQAKIKERDTDASDWKTAARQTFSGICDAGSAVVAAAICMINMQQSAPGLPNGVYLESYATHTVMIEDDLPHMYHANFSLKATGVGETDWDVYMGSKKIASGTHKAEDAKAHLINNNGVQSEYAVNNVFIKHDTGTKFEFYFDKNNNERLDDSDLLIENLTEDTACFTLMYAKTKGESKNQSRIACLKGEPSPSLSVRSPQGQIVVKGATSNAAAIASNGSSETSWENWQNPSDTVVASGDTLSVQGGGVQRVYSHFRFKVDNTYSTNGKFNYKIIRCATEHIGNCKDWIEPQRVGSTAPAGSGLTVTRNSRNDSSCVGQCTFMYDEAIDAAIESELNATRTEVEICYKLFVSRSGITVENANSWNASVACVTHNAQTGDAPADLTSTARLKVRTDISQQSACTFTASDGSTINSSGNLWVKSGPNETKTIVAECPSSVTSVQGIFSHIVKTPNNSQLSYKEWVTAKHGNRRFYHKQVPNTVPNAVDLELMSKDNESDVDGNGNGDGKYNVAPGQTVCETIQVANGEIGKVCLEVHRDTPNVGHMGYTKVTCLANGETLTVPTSSDNVGADMPTLECTGNQVKFEHYISLQTGTTRHRLYHASTGAGSGVLKLDTNRQAPFSVTAYTNSDGIYTLSLGVAQCESQWFGTTGSSSDPAEKSGACAIYRSPISDCEGLSYSNLGLSTTTEIGESTTKSFVRNASVSAYSTFTSNLIYAKPTDKIEFKHCYFPGAQSVRTTKFWDKITAPEPSRPLTGSQCEVDRNADGTYPAGCDSVSFGINSTSTGGYPTTYLVNASQKETLHEANYIGSELSSNSAYNTYTISTTSTPGSTFLGNGIITTSSSSIDSNTIGSGSIEMNFGPSSKYSSSYNSSTGTSGDTTVGVATNKQNLFITVGAPGGTLTQSISAYVGKVQRKKVDQYWYWYFGYNYTGKYTDDDGVEHKVSKTNYCSTASCSKRGAGTGNHGSEYYKRDNTATTFSYSVNNTSASVYIPYNYQNEAYVELDPTTTIYAGESFMLKTGKIEVKPRYNSTTSGTYATIAPDVTAKLYAYVKTSNDTRNANRTSNSSIDGCSYYREGSLPCTEIDSATKTYNMYGNMDGSLDDAFYAKEYNAFDVTAGYYLCVGLAMNPSMTGNTSVNYSSTYYSKPSCLQVYKKPTFAVWGGGVFSNGGVVSNKAEKRTIANYYDLSTGNYSPTGKDRYRIFSSWVEGVIVSNGKVRNTASGASTGYTFIGNAGTGYMPIAAPGGSSERNFCLLSPLTIANSSCAAGYAGYTDIGNALGVREKLYQKYIEPYIDLADTQTTAVNSAIRAITELTATNNTLPRAFGSDANFTLSYGQTRIIASNESINITRNIVYPDEYASSTQLPQLIIYSKKDINISANVTKLNGIFVSEGTINTCLEYNAADKGNAACSTQLQIDGIVMADKIVLNRTFGAATGANSIVPAEIINYDPTNFLINVEDSSSDVTEAVFETYTRELAPRQ